MLNSTLVLWGGELLAIARGRERGGPRPPQPRLHDVARGRRGEGRATVGATDDIGLRAVEEPYHVRDVHTTILHQLGLDQEKLTYPHLGRRERLTLVEGRDDSGRLSDVAAVPFAIFFASTFLTTMLSIAP